MSTRIIKFKQTKYKWENLQIRKKKQPDINEENSTSTMNEKLQEVRKKKIFQLWS